MCRRKFWLQNNINLISRLERERERDFKLSLNPNCPLKLQRGEIYMHTVMKLWLDMWREAYPGATLWGINQMAMILASINRAKQSPGCQIIYLRNGSNMLFYSTAIVHIQSLVLKYSWSFLGNRTFFWSNDVHCHQLSQTTVHLFLITPTPCE